MRMRRDSQDKQTRRGTEGTRSVHIPFQSPYRAPQLIRLNPNPTVVRIRIGSLFLQLRVTPYVSRAIVDMWMLLLRMIVETGSMIVDLLTVWIYKFSNIFLVL